MLPVRGLIGYRGQLLTETRGTALLHQIGEGFGPWAIADTLGFAAAMTGLHAAKDG